MQVEETRKIIAVLMNDFQNFRPIDTEMLAISWTRILQNYSYKQVNMAVQVFETTDTSGFAPIPSQLINIITKISQPEQLNEIEAWTLVSKALRNGYYGAEEEFAKLPPIVQKAVGSPAQLRMWATTDEKSVESVISSNFMRTYKAEVKRAEEYASLPENVKALMQKMSPMNRIEQMGE